MLKIKLTYSSGSDKIQQEYDINVAIGDEKFKSTTVAQLKAKIVEKDELQIVLDETLLKFNDEVLNDKHTFQFYGIKPNSIIELIKEYDPVKHFGIKFTVLPDAITGDNNGQARAVLSCGHAADPNSLTAYCRSIIDQGRHKLTCPAIINTNTNKLCEKEWNYYEIRQIALLNELEMNYFEEKISQIVARCLTDFKECPNCRSYLERQDKDNLRVNCTLCQKFLNKKYEFCWQCEQEWTVTKSTASDTCGRDGCENQYLKILTNCNWIKLPRVANLPEVPSIRACPTCGAKCEHNTENCKNVICPGCKLEFCFACLRPKKVCSTTGGGAYGICSVPVAPIQTVIPRSTQ